LGDAAQLGYPICFCREEQRLPLILGIFRAKERFTLDWNPPTLSVFRMVAGMIHCGGSVALDLFSVLRDTTQRRIWLLTKALENAPLAEALILAQAAEDFVTTAADGTGDLPFPNICGVSTRVH
jgi:hypothetical protein